MALFSQKRAEHALEAESRKVHRADLETLLERQRAIEAKVKASGRLNRFGTDIRLMFSMIRDYWTGRYRSVPWKTIAAVAGALLYVLMTCCGKAVRNVALPAARPSVRRQSPHRRNSPSLNLTLRVTPVPKHPGN